MPLAHNLSKVTKNLSKSKSSGSMHIKGRKFKQLNRATLRDKKITTKKLKSLEQKENELASLFFLQKVINGDEDFQKFETFTLKDMKAFTELFISRYDEEIEKLRSERRPGRPQTSRHTLLEEVARHDRDIYATGFRIPDLTDKATVERLKLWNGSLGGTTIMKFVLITKDMEHLPGTDPTKDSEMK